MTLCKIHKNSARASGAILGFGIALALVLVSLPAASSSPLPAAVRVSLAAAAGELEVVPSPPAAVLFADSLRPGSDPVTANFRIRNQTGSDLKVTLRTDADTTALDGLLRAALSMEGKMLADTTLQGLRRGPVELPLSSGDVARMRLRISIPREILSGYEGRLVHVTIVPAVSPAGG